MNSNMVHTWFFWTTSPEKDDYTLSIWGKNWNFCQGQVKTFWNNGLYSALERLSKIFKDRNGRKPIWVAEEILLSLERMGRQRRNVSKRTKFGTIWIRMCYINHWAKQGRIRSWVREFVSQWELPHVTANETALWKLWKLLQWLNSLAVRRT